MAILFNIIVEFLTDQSPRSNSKEAIFQEITERTEIKTDRNQNNDINLFNYLTGKIDIHDNSRVILFRHFADGLVRVAYLKYGGGKDLYKGLDKLLTLKIKFAMENKKKLKGSGLEDEVIN